MALSQAATAVDHGIVLMLVSLLVLPIAALIFARAGARWREIGKGPFAMEHEPPPTPRRGPWGIGGPLGLELGVAATDDGRAEKEAEIRQMVEARSYLRVRRGEAPLDVDAETERQCADFIGLGE